MTASASNKIALLSLVAGLGLIGFFIYRKLKKDKPNSLLPALPAPASGLNVAQKIQAGYSKDMVTFSDAEVKKYAGWIDAIVSEVEKLKTAAKKEATKTMVYNADVLKSMSDANLKAIVNYWEKVRVSKILRSPIFNHGGGIAYVDNTGTLPMLLGRLMDLGYTD